MIKVRVKGLVSDDVVGVVQCINAGGAMGRAISDGWMLTFVAFIIKLPGDSDDSALPIDKVAVSVLKLLKFWLNFVPTDIDEAAWDSSGKSNKFIEELPDV